MVRWVFRPFTRIGRAICTLAATANFHLAFARLPSVQAKITIFRVLLRRLGLGVLSRGSSPWLFRCSMICLPAVSLARQLLSLRPFSVSRSLPFPVGRSTPPSGSQELGLPRHCARLRRELLGPCFKTGGYARPQARSPRHALRFADTGSESLLHPCPNSAGIALAEWCAEVSIPPTSLFPPCRAGTHPQRHLQPTTANQTAGTERLLLVGLALFAISLCASRLVRGGPRRDSPGGDAQHPLLLQCRFTDSFHSPSGVLFHRSLALLLRYRSRAGIIVSLAGGTPRISGCIPKQPYSMTTEPVRSPELRLPTGGTPLSFAKLRGCHPRCQAVPGHSSTP